VPNWLFYSKLYKNKNILGGWEGGDGWQTWFWSLLLMVMVVIGEVEVHVGPPVEQEKIDQILTNMKNQEKEPNLIKNVLETHSQKMAKMKKGADA
jgi:Na+-transporting methylmalonyl-CoA/oxaloacetate decarboxylase gamma subunit